MGVAAVGPHIQCFSTSNALFSIFTTVKRGPATLEARHGGGRANRLVVCLSSAVLRLQEPVDSACRPFLRIDAESGENEDGDEEGECSRNASIFEEAEFFANNSPDRPMTDLGYHENSDNGVPGQCRSSNGAVLYNSSAEDFPKPNERERLRRERIGLANKGRTPWNKGKCHSLETIARIKAHCKAAMQDPRVREKLRQYSHPQSEETREKIRKYMKSRMYFERMQLTIVQEWKNVIANMARKGMVGDDELQWESYHVLKKELQRQYYATKKGKQKNREPKVLQYAHRLRISESMKAKWADSEYRNKVVKRIQETRSNGSRVFEGKLTDPEFEIALESFARSRSAKGSFSKYFLHPDAKKEFYNDSSSGGKMNKIKLLRFQSTRRKETQFEMEKIDPELGDLKGEMRTDLLQQEAQNVIHNGTSTQCVDATSLRQV